MKVYEVSVGEELNPCTERDPASVLVWLEEAEAGATVTIRVKQMSESEYAALPEYVGP